LHSAVVLQQTLNQRVQRRIGQGHQGGEDVQLFVLVVQWRSHVKVAQHVAGRPSGSVIATGVAQVTLQFGQQREHAINPLVAGLQHLEG
jgi:hypothetical protein